MIKFDFSDKKEVKEIFSRYPDSKKGKQSAINPLLHLAQKENKGWIPNSAVSKISKLCGVGEKLVYENLHFYKMYNKKKITAKYHVIVCTGVCCGSDKIMESVKRYLKIKVGETTKDKMFYLGETGECMGCCNNAPMMVVATFGDDYGYHYYEGLTVYSVVGMLKLLKEGKPPKPIVLKSFERTTLKKKEEKK